jgi:hypothetical protein
MEDFHPATCVVCCKRIVDARRKHPVLVDDWGYICRELWLFAMSFGVAVVFGPLWVLHGIFSKSQKQLREEIRDLARYGIDVTFHDPEDLPDREKQILYEQRELLHAWGLRFKYARNKSDLPWIAGKIRELQAVHDDTARQFKNRYPHRFPPDQPDYIREV